MLTIALPALYFISVFGFFEVLLFRHRIDYWTRPVLVSFYFLSATGAAVALFSYQPLLLVRAAHWLEVVGVIVLVLIVVAGIRAGRFTRAYVVAKSTDILFQDTLAVIVFMHIAVLFEPVLAVSLFGAYFFVIHLGLLGILPLRYAVVFILASFGAGMVFGALVSAGLVVSVFVLHSLFYILMYPTISSLLTTHYPR